MQLALQMKAFGVGTGIVMAVTAVGWYIASQYDPDPKELNVRSVQVTLSIRITQSRFTELGRGKELISKEG